MDRKKTNNIALTLIRILSALSIVILVVILSYLIYRGLRYTNQSELEVLPIAMVNEDFEVYTNKKANLDKVDWFTLQSMAKGRVRTLRTISSVNEKFNLYVDLAVRDKLSSYLAVPISDDDIVNSSSDIDYSSDKGGMIVISPGATAPKNYVKVDVYDSVVAVNEDVTQLLNNRRIGSLSMERIEKIKDGTFKNWNEIGGPDLKINFINNSNAYNIESTPGGVSIVSARSYNDMEGLDTLKILTFEKGWNINLDYLVSNAQESGAFGGIGSIIINTFLMIFLVLLISTPLGVAAAIYLSQYAKRGKATVIIRSGIDLLSGIPSIIFGLFGMLIFVQLFGWGFSLISGCMTLSLMILPTIIRTSEESINTVDKQMIFASRGLGATKIETIFKIVLPAAKKGIVTGVILAIGRALGETAALVFTIGSSTDIASSFTSSSRVLAQHIYLTIIEGQSIDKAFASALVLIILELIINTAARSMIRKRDK